MSSRFRRGTGGLGGTPLEEYGRLGTFGLAVAKKLATTGLTDAEFVQLAKNMGKVKWLPLKRFINYYKEEGFNIVLENGRYICKSEPSKSAVSQTQRLSDAILPTKEDFESAYRMLTSPGESIYIDAVLDQIETSAIGKGLALKSNWRMITEKNIEIWSKKR